MVGFVLMFVNMVVLVIMFLNMVVMVMFVFDSEDESG